MGTLLSRVPVGFLGALLTISAAWADVPPPCRDKRKDILEIDNERALMVKKTKPDQTQVRARISGKVQKIYKDQTEHDHFSIQIGSKPGESVEVVYSQDFGKIPEERLKVGAVVEACGDFIVSKKKTKRYPPSPDGAIIHWVHRSNDPKRHPDGYVLVDRVLYGFAPGGLWFSAR